MAVLSALFLGASLIGVTPTIARESPSMSTRVHPAPWSDAGAAPVALESLVHNGLGSARRQLLLVATLGAPAAAAMPRRLSRSVDGPSRRESPDDSSRTTRGPPSRS